MIERETTYFKILQISHRVIRWMTSLSVPTSLQDIICPKYSLVHIIDYVYTFLKSTAKFSVQQ